MQTYNLSSINNLGVENPGKPLHLLKYSMLRIDQGVVHGAETATELDRDVHRLARRRRRLAAS